MSYKIFSFLEKLFTYVIPETWQNKLDDLLRPKFNRSVTNSKTKLVKLRNEFKKSIPKLTILFLLSILGFIYLVLFDFFQIKGTVLFNVIATIVLLIWLTLPTSLLFKTLSRYIGEGAKHSTILFTLTSILKEKNVIKGILSFSGFVVAAIAIFNSLI